jgi:cytochrome P450
MVIAGHDTVTAALSWALYLLGKHPSVLEQAQAEVDAVMGHEPPTMQHITNLRYLDCVINEALRLYPPAHVGSRIAAVDLDFQDYRIPVGTRVMYSIYLTQRMKEHWPDPARFNPDRFLPENGHLRAPYTFLPFGGGARTCIGLAYAQVETKVVLARLLQTHNFRLMREKFHLHMGATIEPRPGVIMTTTPR